MNFSDSFLNGDKIAVHFKIGATIGDLPEEMKEYPMFPGQDPDKMKGKTFETTGLHFHVVQDGKIKKTWCIVYWSSALSEIGGGPNAFNAASIFASGSLPGGRMLLALMRSGGI